jgi:hypothetical protein
VLAIKNDQAELVFLGALDSEIWKARLTKAEELIRSAAQAVGRIDLENAGLDWVGNKSLSQREFNLRFDQAKTLALYRAVRSCCLTMTLPRPSCAMNSCAAALDLALDHRSNLQNPTFSSNGWSEGLVPWWQK